MTLYEKYRPKTLSEVLGNNSFTEKALESHHSLLFYSDGPGRGKTTLSRIIKNILQIEDFNYMELNGADYTGVDDMRNLMESIKYPPIGKRLIVLDEAHRLSGNAWDLLLKPLEDGIERTYFIICTTEMKKIPETVASRCGVFYLGPVPEDQVFNLLRRVAKEEGEDVDTEILLRLAQGCDGGVRKALVALASIISVNVEKRLETCESIYYDTEGAEVIDLCRKVYAGTWSEVSAILKVMKKNGNDPNGIRSALLGYGCSLLLSNKMSGAICEYFTTLDSNGFNGLIVQVYSAMSNRR